MSVSGKRLVAAAQQARIAYREAIDGLNRATDREIEEAEQKSIPNPTSGKN